MTDILCPTCGRPNSENHSSCDFCGGPLGEEDITSAQNSSLRDDLFSNENPNEPLEPKEPMDEASRLDSLFSPDPLPPDSQKEPGDQPPESLNDISRLDDLIPAPESTEVLPEEEIQTGESLDDSSLLDDIFGSDDPLQEPKPQNNFPTDDLFPDDISAPELPSQDPLPDSASEDDQLQEKSSTETPGEDWDFLTEPSSSSGLPQENSPAEESQGDWGFLTPDPSSDDNLSPEKISAEKPLGDWDFLTPDPSSKEAQSQDLDDPIPDFGSPGFSDDSDWLDMLQDPETREELASETSSDIKKKKPHTGWLDKIKRLDKSTEHVDEDSSFPDWLSVSEKPAAEPEPEPEPETTPQPVPEIQPGPASPDLPAWLQLDGDDESLNEFLRRKDLTNKEYKPKINKEPTGELVTLEDDDEPAADLSDSQQIKFPSWAGDESKKEDVPEDLQFLAGYDPDSPPPDGVDALQIEEEEYFDDLFNEELPDWLTSASSEEVIKTTGEALSQGDLPGWVEAMRPAVESSDLAEEEDYIENYGPLAGIPSVLPAEAEIALDLEKDAKKPLDLITSKTNQEYVNLLKKLIGEENKAKTILRPAPVQTQRILRWLIAIIMLVTTAGTVIFGGNIETEPPTQAQIQNTGYGALYDQIEKLYDSQPVLIAFDYQPAAAGELHAAAAGVVDHLMEQGTYLSFVSTQPTGPALAENFLETTQEAHRYRHTQQYINLGYLPGESAGLLSFVIAPKKIIPLAFDGSNAWGSPPLVNVDSINDFEMILVITDDPDTAKIWIEQVGTILDDTPLTMVVSAQVEPLIQPYFRSSPQLLSGYVSGIIDSMNYEQILGRPNLANETWLPFNLGIFIAVGTIFIGGLANGVLSIFSRHRSKLIGDTK